MKFRFLIIVLLAGFSISSFSQVLSQARIDSILNAQILSGDSIPHIELSEISVRPKPVFKNRRDARRYWRLVYNLKKVLPFSTLIAATVQEVDDELSKLETDKQRRKFVRSIENTLWDEYEDDLRKMTVTQGRLLFKLVDRETSSTTYFWIEHYQGKISAFFWQGIARLFSSNLKTEYDPLGKDKQIEELIPLILLGYI